jgi:asparagine synthase (glutamine-hydrolysing)
MPFLDYRLVSFVFSLPPEFKIHDGLSKTILRRALKKDIPSLILDRRDKIGFVTPEAEWFRTEMKDRMKDVFHSSSIRARGLYRVRRLRELFQKHLDGSVDASRPLWRAFHLELWMRKYID